MPATLVCVLGGSLPGWGQNSAHSSIQQTAGYETPPEPREDDAYGSANVPMDSWVYPALERLAALGFVPSQSITIRPWTRKECLRQVREAGQIGVDSDADNELLAEVDRLLGDLERECGPAIGKPPARSGEAVLDSVYTRYAVIAGPALTDGFHFGQTWRNDFGRPLGRGSSEIAGFTVHAVYHRFFFFDRQELQQDPGLPAVTAARSQLFNQLDNIPFGSPVPGFNDAAPPVSAYPRQRPLELYAGMAFAGNAISFGKQEIFWGPTTMGPLSFSSNAEPTYNLRLTATRPHPFPFVPDWGSYRFDVVFGKLSGHKYPARPYFNGGKLELSFFDTLEVGVTRWSILWGQGHPMTLGNLKRNIFSFNSTGSSFGYGDREDPGDRKSGFDFRLHVPGLRRLLTLYADSYADDEPNPIDAPRRVVWSPGLYVTRLPWLPNVDLRLEAVSSEELSQDEGGTRFFINNQYRDGNTNKGFLLGNAIGRDARAYEATSTWWHSARTTFGAGFRHTNGGNFLPGGESITDSFVNANYVFHHDWSAQVFAQYERFLVPSMMPGAQHNESGWLQITWNPSFQLTRPSSIARR